MRPTIQRSMWSLGAMQALFSLVACGAPALPASEETAESASRPVDETDPFTGKTLLYYESSHGNQIAYFAPDGHCFLWYPGNRIALRGDFRLTEGRLCHRYGEDTYNPVTMESGGYWECRSIEAAQRWVIDRAPGDRFDLSTENVPFSLPAHPRYESLSEVK